MKNNKNKSTEEIPNINLTETLNELKKENKDDIYSKEALDSLKIANQLINSIMSGKHVNVAYFKQLAASKQSRARFIKNLATNVNKKNK